MCYGWEPDDIVLIITNLHKNKENNALEIINKSLEETALELGKTYKDKDYPNINLKSFISHIININNENIEIIKNELNEIIIETKYCKIYEIFKSLNCLDIGFQYKCRQDYFILNGYDKTSVLTIEKCLMKGDKCCIHHYIKN